MSHDLSQPIRFKSLGLKFGDRQTHAPASEGPHSVGVWTLKINFGEGSNI